MLRSGSTSTPGITSFSGWRRRSAKCVVPGTRASSTTRGRAAWRSSSTIEIAAPSNTPLTGPEPSTPNMAAMATRNSARLKRQMCWSALNVDQARDRREHDRRQHRLRQVAQQSRCKQHDEQGEEGRDQAGHRRSRAGALVDQRLRHAAAHRKAATESREADCRRRPPATPGWRRTDSRASGRTSGRWRTLSTAASTKPASAIGSSSFRSRRLTAGNPREGRPCGTSPSNATPCASRSMKRAASMPATTTTNATGRFLSQRLPAISVASAIDADEQRHRVGVAADGR